MSRGALIIIAGLVAVLIIGGGLFFFMREKHSQTEIQVEKSQLSPVLKKADNARPPKNLAPPFAKEPKKSQNSEEENSMASEDYESIMNRFFRGNPVAKFQNAANSSTHEYNQWSKTRHQELESVKMNLEQELAAIHGIETGIEDMDRRLKENPRLKDTDSVDRYNALVLERNALVEKHKKLVTAFKKKERVFNDSVARFNLDQDLRKKVTEGVIQRAEAEADAYKRFMENGEDLSFYKNINHEYAKLAQEKRRLGGRFEKKASLKKIAALKEELGSRAAKEHEKRENGLIIVPATLCGRERAYLIVDTGATICTITPDMVVALELSDSLGKEIEVTLAGGVTIKGSSLVIPSISVFGKEAKDIDAIVLKASEVGLDGIMGQSFLDRFHYRIDKKHTPVVILGQKQ